MSSEGRRKALVTGTSTGLGREIALGFAQNGYDVAFADRDAAMLDEVMALPELADVNAVPVTLELTSEASINDGLNAAIEGIGGLDVVVNNAGILRDRYLVTMTEDEFDAVVNVHLKGHFAPTRHAAAYWRDEHKAGRAAPRNLVHTSSTSGLFANPGQTNYGAAKSGIATMSQIAAKELGRYGVVSNCIAPGARTRLTLATPGLEDIMTPPDAGFDNWDPANVAPLVAYLSTPDCPFSGETFYIKGGVVKRVTSWEMADRIETVGAWTVDELREAMQPMTLQPPVDADMN